MAHEGEIEKGEGGYLPGQYFPGGTDYGTIPSDLIRDEIAETQLFRDFISKFGDKLEGKTRSQAAADWLEALVKYGSGDATLKDMQEVDVSGLMDVEGFEDYYNDIVIVQAPTDYTSIYKILKGAGYSDEAIDEIERASVDNKKFKGNNVLATILRDLGYEADNWEVSPVGDSGLKEGDKCATVTNGPLDGTIQGGECVPTTPAGPDCKVITQENADECGYEISSDGQLVPKDLGKDPESYPTYVSCGGGIFAETINDCPDMEGTGSQIPEDQTKTSQAIKDWIEGQIGKVKDLTVDDVLETVFGGGAFDPLCKDESDIWNCAGTDGTEGNKCWKDCVSASVLGGIPGLPMPPGAVDIGTVRDLENKVNEIGGSIADIFDVPEGETDDEGWIQKTKDWVIGKIDDIFGGIDDVTPGQITDWVVGILGPAASGIILQQIEGTKNSVIDKINEIAGLPLDTPTELINCADYEREGGEVSNVNECGNCFEKGVEPGEDGRCRRVIKDDFDVSEVEATCKREGKEYNDLLDECGDCIKPGYGPGPTGFCEPLDGDDGTDTGTGTTETKCEDRNAQNSGELGDCGECNTGYSRKPGQTLCTKDDDTGDTTEVYDPDCETDPRPTGLLTFNLENKQKIWDQKCGGTVDTVGGDDVTTTVDDDCSVINADNYQKCGKVDCFTNSTPGPYVDSFSECPADDDVDDSGDDEPAVTKCEDPNALNNGQDGPCRYDPSDPCLSADYAAANPTECGTAPLDCSDPAYAAANPDECGTTTPPETPSGGGGGGGGAGGASGMFDLESFEVTGDPQLLAKMEFPITDFLSGSMFKDYV